MRKTRVFQKDAYISINYLEKKTEVIRLKNIKPSEDIDPLAIVLDLGKGKRKKQIYFENPEIEDNNAIKDEFISFANSINEDIEPQVSITDGLRALELAESILDKMKLSHQLI
jgi:predicted dehydrogenase